MSNLIPSTVIQDVLHRSDILQVIGDYVQLKRAGSSYKGLCPLHGEKTPSFHVTPSKGLFYCFGCGEGGSSIDFLMKMEGLAFPEAIRRLGGRFGIDIPDVGQDVETYRRVKREKETILEILEMGCDFFRRQLSDARVGKVARDYLVQRGIREDVASVYRLGYAPESWDALLNHFEQRDVALADVERAGLLIARDQEDRSRGYYDRFRHRLIFPVIDSGGRVVAFGGRTLETEGKGAKYINSPESSVYVKGKNLYGIHAAKDSMRRSREAILVEGNIDVIKMYQAGFHNTVAPMGTAMTDEQGRLLKRFSDRVICLFDGDKAGKKAGLRAVEPIQKAELDGRIALLPDGEDPDTLIANSGVDAMRRLLDEVLPLLRWAVEGAASALLDLPLEARPGAMDELTRLVHTIASPIVQRQYIDELARRLDYTAKELTQLLGLEKTREADADRPAADPIREYFRKAKGPSRFRTRPEPYHEQDLDAIEVHNASELLQNIELQLLRVLLDDTDFLFEFVEANGLLLLHNAVMVSLIEEICELAGEKREIDIQGCLAALEPGPARDLLVREASVERPVDESLYPHWFRGAVATLQLRWIEEQTTWLSSELVRADHDGREDEVEKLLQHQTYLSRLRVVAKRERKVGDALQE